MKKQGLKAALVLSVVAIGGTVLASCGESAEDKKNYTYRTYLATSPKSWNAHTWDTNDQSYIIGFTEMGLYDVILNENKDGFTFTTEMASGDPVDVSDKLSETDKKAFFGDEDINIAKGSGIAWEIPLNTAATWEDGTPITADDYVESMKLLLDPLRINRRADSFYAGTLQLANAANYFKQGTDSIEPAYNYVKDSTTFVPTDDNFAANGVWYVDLGSYTPYVKSVFSNADETMGFVNVLTQRGSKSTAAVESAAKRIEEGVGRMLIQRKKVEENNGDWVNIETYSQIKGDLWKNPISFTDFDNYQSNENTFVPVYDGNGKETSEREAYTSTKLKADMNTFLSGISNKRGTNAWRLASFSTLYNDITVDWSQVGIRKVNDSTIRLITKYEKSVTELDLRFALGSNWIVKRDLYESLTNNNHQTKYASTSVENYMSYGPYKLDKFQQDKQIVMVKNDKWYGYSDNKHVGQFQTEKFETEIISKHETAMQKFEKGEIDDIELNAADMKTYGTSSRVQFSPESYTQKISFNSDYNVLEKRQTSGVNKTILANKNFRQGLSLAINRNEFAAQTTAGSQASTNLLNSLYVSRITKDDNGKYVGATYRETEQGKKVYGEVYNGLGGATIGSNQALSEKSQGYNKALAIEYIKAAKAEELASTKTGHFTAEDTVKIEFRVYNKDSDTTKAMFAFLIDSFKTVGDQAGIRIELEMVQDEDYYTSAKNGNYDMIFSTWGGAQMNPWGLMEVYAKKSFESCCEYGFDQNSNLALDSDGDGSKETKSYDTWYAEMESIKDTSDANYNRKLSILAGIEAGIVSEFCAIPLIARSSASITSFKVSYATENYIPFIGYGGVRYMTFNYTDAEYQAKIDSGEITKDSYKQ